MLQGDADSYHSSSATIQNEDVVASLRVMSGQSEIIFDRLPHRSVLTLTAFTDPGRRSLRRAAMAAASGSVIIRIVSRGRDPKPAAAAASRVALRALSVQIAGIVK